jgi:hypothetical protein
VKLRAGGKGAGRFGRGAGAIVENRGVGHGEIAGDLREARVIHARGDADEFEFVAVRRDDAQRAFAHGTGGAEQDDAFRRG